MPASEPDTEPGTRPAPNSRTALRLVIVALLLGAIALWGSSALVWFAEARDGGVRGTVLHTENGAQRSSALVPLAILGVAGVAGMVATGGLVRRVLGLVLALAGLAACWIAVDGLSFGGYPDQAPVAQIYTGRGLAALGGILLVAGGVAGIRATGRMARLGSRYAAPTAKQRPKDPDTALWEALSEGEDPTAGR